ncbi:hypothetical protein GQ43DRAFT_466011 [Delitschia confertaspora ATCC 74209]|uniref:Uncharacterized protein n=1 Tax=Delitschia confertaspora ATCC 74209 TaxID=1513339 RepID=A0A9P4JIQ4_9PLEO|nr:hypothetical protein GQ43DRAFT_466011 [Delitschia confertaspora ATCC 74209]
MHSHYTEQQELSVFELLEDIDLPGFNQSNWRSTIRSEVCVHPKYTDMQPQPGRETVDNFYENTENVLTNVLLDGRYFSNAIGTPRQRQPTYSVEVRPTTAGCEEAFYMSRMRYELVYVDLKVQRLQGRLGFSAEK